MIYTNLPPLVDVEEAMEGAEALEGAEDQKYSKEDIQEEDSMPLTERRKQSHIYTNP